MLQDAASAATSCSTTSPGSRAATRSSTTPARTWSPASTAPTSPPARTRWRPTRSGRTCPTSPTTTSRTGSASWPRRAPGSPARSPTRWRPPDRPRFVLGSVGPGTKLPTLGHESVRPPARRLRRVRPRAARRRRRRARRRDLPGPAAGQGRGARRSRRAMAAEGRRVPIITHVTVETTGTMLLGSEIGAALTALEPLGVDLIGLNCATGPGRDERAPAHPVQARADPAVGDAERRAARAGPARRGVPAQPGRAGRGAQPGSSASTGCGWSAAAAGRPRSTSAPVADAMRDRSTPARRAPAPGAGRQLALRARCRSGRTPRC